MRIKEKMLARELGEITERIEILEERRKTTETRLVMLREEEAARKKNERGY